MKVGWENGQVNRWIIIMKALLDRSPFWSTTSLDLNFMSLRRAKKCLRCVRDVIWTVLAWNLSTNWCDNIIKTSQKMDSRGESDPLKASQLRGKNQKIIENIWRDQSAGLKRFCWRNRTFLFASLSILTIIAENTSLEIIAISLCDRLVRCAPPQTRP